MYGVVIKRAYLHNFSFYTTISIYFKLNIRLYISLSLSLARPSDVESALETRPTEGDANDALVT